MRTLRVLIIEDNEQDALLIREALAAEGYEPVERVIQIECELRQALAQGEWDIILSDHHLPSFDSLAAMAVLTEAGLDIPFIIVSGTIGEETAVRVMRAGASDVVPKGQISRLGPAVARELSQAALRKEGKLVETELKLFRTLMDHSTDMIEVVDGDTGRLLDVNRSLCTNLGYSRDELLQMTVPELDPTVDAANFLHNVDSLRKTGSLVWEGVHRRKDGSTFPVEVNIGHVLHGREYLVAVVRDITERKEAERTLTMLQKAIERSGDMIFMTDTAGIITFVNPQFSKVYGYSAEEIVGKATPRVLKGGEIPAEEYAVLWDAILSGQTASREFVNKAKDGRLLRVEASVNPIVDEQGGVTGFLAVQRDITERRKNEEELRRSHAELEDALERMKQMQNVLVQSEKLASVGQLTAGIAHEINNPLSYISSNINLFEEYFSDVCSLLDDWKALGARFQSTNGDTLAGVREREREIDLPYVKEDFVTLIRHTREGAGRIKSIVDKLRGFVHVAGGEASNAAVNEMIEDTLVMVHNELKYTAQVVKEFGDIPPLRCNPGEIKQVLINLLVNAGHAIRERGTVTIRTRVESGAAVIDIADTGEGILPEHLNRIFDPFFTTKPVGKGTGLGLWLSNSIVAKHNGTLSVVSERGKGSTFSIRLPLNGE